MGVSSRGHGFMHGYFFLHLRSTNRERFAVSQLGSREPSCYIHDESLHDLPARAKTDRVKTSRVSEPATIEYDGIEEPIIFPEATSESLIGGAWSGAVRSPKTAKFSLVRNRAQMARQTWTTDDLRRTSMRQPSSFGYGKGLRKANLRRAVLSGDDLSGLDFAGADLRNSQLVGTRGDRNTNFTKAKLQGAALTNSSFAPGTRFWDANFSGAVLSGSRLSGADCQGAKFSFASIREVDFSGANLSGAIFDGAHIENCNFDGAYPHWVKFLSYNDPRNQRN